MKSIHPFNTYMQSFWYIHDIHLAVRNDYTEQTTSDISVPSFHIHARYMLINGQGMLDVLAIEYVWFYRFLEVYLCLFWNLQIDNCIVFLYFYLISQVSYLASERTSKWYENHTPILFKNTYCVTEILIKKENYFSFYFHVFIHFYNYAVRGWYKMELIVLI